MSSGEEIVRWCLFFLLGFLMAGCSGPSGFKEHAKFVNEHMLDTSEVSKEYLSTGDFQLHFRQAGNAKKAVVVWVHGTPGNWTDGAYLYRDKSLITDTKLVLIDRPGWGESQYLDNPRVVTSFQQIGELISPLLRKLKQEHPEVPLLLLGFSWGGSLVPAIALDYPDLVDGLLVLSGGLDPELTKPRWYNKAAKIRLVNAMIGDSMRKANVEMYALSPELALLQNRLTEISQPTIVIQGDTDKLVDPKNADFAEEKFSSNRIRVIRLADQGHLLQLERTDLIAKCIYALIDEDLKKCS